MPTLNTNLPNQIRQIMKLCRFDMSIAIQNLSGHNFLLHHEKNMTLGENRKHFLNWRRRLCNREEESSKHVIFNCNAHAVKRADMLGKYFLNPKKDKLDLQKVLELIKSAVLTDHPTPEGHLTNLNPPTM